MSFFVSSRNRNETVDARMAMVRGLSADGGLYVPVEIPRLDYRALSDLTYNRIAQRIVHAWFNDLDKADIEECCDEAYLNHFDTPIVAPVVKAGDTNIVELFHGETCAFKDVALSLLPRLLIKSKSSLGADEKVLILTATSGDTGSAAMNGFKDVTGTGIITFYPFGGVSPLQRRQMVSMDGKNVCACAVRGNFDDCQSAVKQAFIALPTEKGVSFSSANSINIARLVPQIGYYYTTYITLLKRAEIEEGEKLSFVVPTGNFGDILAGFYAKCMGLPIGKLICASNANDVLTEFLTKGRYDRRRAFLKTCSPSMDILISSNLERLLFHVQDGDSKLVCSQMESLRKQGFYEIDKRVLKGIREDFCAYSFDDRSTLDTVRTFYRETGYLADPHTAVALAAEKQYKNEYPGEKCAVLSTASPFKFASCIAQALDILEEGNVFDTLKSISEKTKVPVPSYLAALSGKKERHTDVIEKTAITAYIQEKYPKLL